MAIIKNLAQQLQKSELEVSSFLHDAPLKYKIFTIPKRRSGQRVIAQPSKMLKEYQRAFLQVVNLPVHSCAMAYVKGKSIKQNALIHQENRYLLKMDLENFFNSITPKVFWEQWNRHFTQTNDQLLSTENQLIQKLLFWSPSKKINGKLILSVGAPSSPSVSNFIMLQFDELIHQCCIEKNIAYSRYADDLTFSTNIKDILFELPKLVEVILKQCFGNKIIINKSKTVFSSKAHNRRVTGITITNEQAISLGRERKRYIKHLVHQYKIAKLDKNEIDHLKGQLGFALHIESKFISSLEKKYSTELISNLLKE